MPESLRRQAAIDTTIGSVLLVVSATAAAVFHRIGYAQHAFEATVFTMVPAVGTTASALRWRRAHHRERATSQTSNCA